MTEHRLQWSLSEGRSFAHVGGIDLVVHGDVAYVDGVRYDVPPETALVATEALARKLLAQREAEAAAGLAALNGMGPWQRDAKVTLCDDAEGARPRRVATIGRLARAGFRLVGSGEWYGFDGKKTHGLGPAFVRPYRDGDENAILEEDARARAAEERAAKLRDLKRQRREAERSMDSFELRRLLDMLGTHEHHARDLRKTIETYEAKAAVAAARAAEIDAEIVALTGGAK